MARIAVISYLNCAPFYWNAAPSGSILEGAEWVKAPPSRLGELARAGEVEAGPFSLIDSFSLEKDFEPLKNLGIAVREAAGSVSLYSKTPLQTLSKQHIGMTAESVTSCGLLKIILRGKHGLDPVFHPGFEANDDARLYIGDPALEKRSDARFRKRFPFETDLGLEWRDWKELPFVFARWMVRKDSGSELKETLAGFLEGNVALSRKDLSVPVRWFEKESGRQIEGAEKYLAGFNYCFGAEEFEAIEVFKDALSIYARTEKALP